MKKMLKDSSIAACVVFMLLFMTSFAEAWDEYVQLGQWTQMEWDSLLSTASEIQEVGQRIDFLSELFLEVTYKNSTLIGDRDTPEVFVMNLQAVDCFTYLDYVEAMRRSASFDEFKHHLKHVRYWSGEVRFESRNHFFTDWEEFQSGYIENITERIGGKKTETVTKRLNDRGSRQAYVPGIPSKVRMISYIPSHALDDAMLNMLQTGDYIGIYTAKRGIDVTHTGIVIKKPEGVYLRHASASRKYRKVIDQDFKQYVQRKYGIIIFRPVEKELLINLNRQGIMSFYNL